MTAKEQVLQVYPDAVSKWSSYELQYVICHRPLAHVEILGMGDTRKQAWENALQEIKPMTAKQSAWGDALETINNKAI